MADGYKGYNAIAYRLQESPASPDFTIFREHRPQRGSLLTDLGDEQVAVTVVAIAFIGRSRSRYGIVAKENHVVSGLGACIACYHDVSIGGHRDVATHAGSGSLHGLSPKGGRLLGFQL